MNTMLLLLVVPGFALAAPSGAVMLGVGAVALALAAVVYVRKVRER